MNTIIQRYIPATLIMLLSLTASAQTLLSDPADGTVDATSVVDTVSFESQAGQLVTDRALILPFQLPDLGVGNEFGSASLRLMLFGQNAEPGQNADLYGLSRISATPDILSSDFYIGANDPTETKLQDEFFTTSSPGLGTPVNSTAAGDAALLSWMNTQYDSGVNVGDYVFLRLSSDVNPPGDTRYNILTNNAGGANEKPLLTYSVVAIPEPGTLALSLIALGALVWFRRR